ncbi:MAG TPA: sugar ABC transporter permease [Caldilineaceae bacterium]|nr:sugar ABC transporter permease [Caldilineaceae bacterium]
MVSSSQRRPLRLPGRRSRRFREAALAYLFLLPTLAGLLFFSLGPVVAGFVVSFTNWNILLPPQWVGLDNYRALATLALPRKVFWNTLYYTLLNVPLNMVVALAAALLLNQRLRWVSFYRAIYFLPVVSSTVAASLIWTWLYSPNFGPINYFLGLIGIQGPAWLGSTTWAMPAVILMSVWKGFGTNMLIFLAGLQGIPQELQEAAMIDGANRWQRFWRVTWPLLTPTTFFVLVVSCIASFQVFEQVYVMTEGGPAYATTVLGLFIYLNAFRYNNMGYAAAVAYVLFALILAVTLAQFKFQGRWTYYEQ